MNYTYTLTTALDSTADIHVYGDGEHLYTINRVYSNKLKRLVDGYFDYRYFLQYDVKSAGGEVLATCKKIQRKGRLWFEAYQLPSREPYVVNYENWRIGIPELYIKGREQVIKIDKDIEDWSNFLVDDVLVARWLAVYEEDRALFHIQFEVLGEVHVPLLLAIAQATLFIGA